MFWCITLLTIRFQQNILIKIPTKLQSNSKAFQTLPKSSHNGLTPPSDDCKPKNNRKISEITIQMASKAPSKAGKINFLGIGSEQVSSAIT